MRSLAVLTVLAAAAVALPTELQSDRVPAQCKLLSANSVQVKSQQLGLYLCEAADGQFMLAADQLAGDVTLDKEALLKLRSDQLIRHKRQIFPGGGFGGGYSNANAQASSGSLGFGGGPGLYGGGFGGGFSGASATAGAGNAGGFFG